MNILIGILVGITVSSILFIIFLRSKKVSGSFIIDFTDPMKDVCRIELEEDLDAICKKKQIIFKVKTYGISQQ